jgi:hypothetical protein
MKVGRNDPCPCGSGEKYKKCCLQKDEAARSVTLAEEAAKRTATEAEAAEAADAGDAEGAKDRAPRAATPAGPPRGKTAVSPRPPPRRRRAGT